MHHFQEFLENVSILFTAVIEIQSFMILWICPVAAAARNNTNVVKKSKKKNGNNKKSEIKDADDEEFGRGAALY